MLEVSKRRKTEEFGSAALPKLNSVLDLDAKIKRIPKQQIDAGCNLEIGWCQLWLRTTCIHAISWRTRAAQASQAMHGGRLLSMAGSCDSLKPPLAVISCRFSRVKWSIYPDMGGMRQSKGRCFYKYIYIITILIIYMYICVFIIYLDVIEAPLANHLPFFVL